MATVSYTFVDRCDGGGHVRLDVSFNGSASRRIVYTTDDLRAPLSDLSQDDQAQIALAILKIHMAGKTRAQIATEFANPVTVTI